MINKFLNLKVGVELYERLMTQPDYEQNWKAVSPAFYLVKRIAALNYIKDGQAVEFYSKTIGDIFKPYTAGRYLPFLAALRSLGILDYRERYRATLNKTGDCRKYKVTDLGCQLLNSSNMEYLKALTIDPQQRRRNQKNISNRKVISKFYDDPVLDYVYDCLKHLSFDYEEAERMIAKSVWSNAQQANVSGILCSIRTKLFDELEVGEKDGRIHHELVRLKSDARVLLNYKDLPYKAVVDIRSCHPTFFSLYLLNHSNTHQYLTVNTDKATALQQEHAKWICLFSNPASDPKQVIRKACRLKDIETAKAAMNESLNGSKQHPKYLVWLKTEFPTLFAIWQTTEVKDTGNAIARTYENPLILNNGLNELANKLSLKIMPEHDGFGVFTNEEGEELQTKLDSLKDYVQSLSSKLFGIPIVIKTKLVFDWASGDLRLEMEHKRGELDKEYSKLKPVLARRRRQYFATGKTHAAWQDYQEAKEKEKKLLQRYRDVIAYWSEREKHQAAWASPKFDESELW